MKQKTLLQLLVFLSSTQIYIAQNNFKLPENQKPNFEYTYDDLKNNEFTTYGSSSQNKSEVFVYIEESSPEESSNAKVEKLDLSHFRRKTSKIVSCKIDQKSVMHLLTLFIE